MYYDLITLLGPTASGKTALAVRLAQHLNAEILSADSRQVYRGMDIGTGKDLTDYKINGNTVPYHLIDIVNAGTRYDVYQYQRDFLRAYQDIKVRGKNALLCGGSGMYIEAVTKGYALPNVPPDEALRASLDNKSMEELTAYLQSLKKTHNKTDMDTRKRVIRAIEIELFFQKHPRETFEYPVIKNSYIGLNLPREMRRERITARLHQRLKEGMVEEAEQLLQQGVSIDDMLFYGLEYKYLALFLTGSLSYDEMVRQLNTAIHQFAKRQMTWFRGMERRGNTIHWIDATLSITEQVAQAVEIISEKNQV